MGALLCATAPIVRATGVPFGGFLPFVGIGLTDEFDTFEEDILFSAADLSEKPGGTPLGAGTNPYFDVALLDTGANGTLLTMAADAGFGIAANGFRGINTIPIGGATGSFDATVNNPLGLYASGLQNRQPGAALDFDDTDLIGQTSVSLLTLPAESDLPNVLGLPFASRFATAIRSDTPLIYSSGGSTVRAPSIEFLPRGSGGSPLGIQRHAPLILDPGQAFSQAPTYVPDFFNIVNDIPLHVNPTAHTVMNDGVVSTGAMFVSVDVENVGESLNDTNFLFDTGADVTVVSEINAARLGFDVILDEPDFTVAVVGSGGVALGVPGFFVEELTIEAVGGNITANNVPVIVLDVTNPSDPGNIVDGILGTNMLAGRNVVIDPNPSLGGGGLPPRLYISDPVTTQHDWTSAAPSGAWTTVGNWNAAGVPDVLGVTNVRHVAGGNQQAIITSDLAVWELNVSGGGAGETMTVQLESGASLTTFSGINLEAGGAIHLRDARIDTQYLEILGGSLSGSGSIATGSGPIPGQVENRIGTVAPGDGIGKLEITGRYANGIDGTLEIELGGTTPTTEYDTLAVDGPVVFEGTLEVKLVDLGVGIFSPSPGDAFEIITYTGDRAGMFDEILLPPGIHWDLDFNHNGGTALLLSVLPSVAGDYNGDGVVDPADYTKWQDTMGSMTDLAADGNGNQVIDRGDYDFWVEHFGNVGTGSELAVSAVPEATCGALAWLALALVSLKQRGRFRP